MNGRVLNDRYQLDELLSSSEQSLVWLATDRASGQQVVIKLPKGDTPAVKRAFVQVANQVKDLAPRYPGLISVLDFNSDNGEPYLVMPWMRGKSLAQHASTARANAAPYADWHRELQWLLDVAATLDQLHADQFLHRDISPANIVLNEFGAAKLIDFDMMMLGPQSASTRGHRELPAPPDAREGPRSDQYLLAATVYFVYTGVAPMNPLTPIHQLQPGIPVSASPIVHRALARESGHRFPSCREFAQQLIAALQSPDESNTPAVSLSPPSAPVPLRSGADGPGRPSSHSDSEIRVEDNLLDQTADGPASHPPAGADSSASLLGRSGRMGAVKLDSTPGASSDSPQHPAADAPVDPVFPSRPAAAPRWAAQEGISTGATGQAVTTDNHDSDHVAEPSAPVKPKDNDGSLGKMVAIGVGGMLLSVAAVTGFFFFQQYQERRRTELEDAATARAVDDTLEITEDIDDSGNLLDNDGGEGLKVVRVNSDPVPANGSTIVRGEYGRLNIAQMGGYIYSVSEDAEIPSDEIRVERFRYEIESTDGKTQSQANLTVKISGVNQPPKTEHDSITLTAITTERSIGVLENDTDPDADSMILAGVRQHGKSTWSNEVDLPHGIKVAVQDSYVVVSTTRSGLQPIPGGQVIPLVVEYLVTDDHDAESVGDILLTLKGDNDPPELGKTEATIYITAGAEHTATNQKLFELFEATDVDQGDKMTVQLESREFTWTEAPGYSVKVLHGDKGLTITTPLGISYRQTMECEETVEFSDGEHSVEAKLTLKIVPDRNLPPMDQAEAGKQFFSKLGQAYYYGDGQRYVRWTDGEVTGLDPYFLKRMRLTLHTAFPVTLSRKLQLSSPETTDKGRQWHLHIINRNANAQLGATFICELDRYSGKVRMVMNSDLDETAASYVKHQMAFSLLRVSIPGGDANYQFIRPKRRSTLTLSTREMTTSGAILFDAEPVLKFNDLEPAIAVKLRENTEFKTKNRTAGELSVGEATLRLLPLSDQTGTRIMAKCWITSTTRLNNVQMDGAKIDTMIKEGSRESKIKAILDRMKYLKQTGRGFDLPDFYLETPGKHKILLSY